MTLFASEGGLGVAGDAIKRTLRPPGEEAGPEGRDEGPRMGGMRGGRGGRASASTATPTAGAGKAKMGDALRSLIDVSLAAMARRGDGAAEMEERERRMGSAESRIRVLVRMLVLFVVVDGGRRTRNRSEQADDT
jgi:hypothetical protein